MFVKAFLNTPAHLIKNPHISFQHIWQIVVIHTALPPQLMAMRVFVNQTILAMKRLLSLLLPLSMLAACGIENEETRKVQDTYQPKDGEMSAVYTIKDIRADETDGTKWLIEAQPDAGGELQFKVDPATYHGPTEDELQKGLGKKSYYCIYQ